MPYIYSHEALSGEARAAKGWTGALEDQKWISMQLSTFRNWVNDHLAKTGSHAEDLALDFSDGTLLIALLESLQNRKCIGRVYRENPTEIQMLSNVQLALDAMQEDGVKLVNIAIPELNITNFKGDWNDGIALRLENCQEAMQVAKDQFGIPMVLSPEDMTSSSLDELSCMTYLSYFMKEHSPGYDATLSRARRLAGSMPIRNFKDDWNDGFVLCQIVHTLGGHIPGWPNLSKDPTQWIKNNNFGIAGARQLGVEPVLSAQELADKEVEHLAVMAYATRLSNVRKTNRSRVESPKIKCSLEPLSFIKYHTQQQVNLDVVFNDKNLKLEAVEAFVSSSSGYEIEPELRRSMKGAVISFTPSDPGAYQIRAYCLGEEINGSPVPVQVVRTPTPSPPFSTSPGAGQSQNSRIAMENSYIQQQNRDDINKVSFSGLSEPCAVGSIVEVVINAHGTSQGNVLVEASSPTGHLHKCQVIQKGNSYTATFIPNEVGEWKIAILYDGDHIRGSPFSCSVYDANLVQVYGLDVGVVGQELAFNVNTSQAGMGELNVDVVHHGRHIPNRIEPQGSGLHRVQFTPDGPGQYKIHIYFNNMEVKGSPFILDIVDASSVSVYGDNLRMASADKLSTFMIHAVGAESKDLSVTVVAPSGKKKRARVVPCGDSTYQVEWKPFEAGENYIDVRLYNQSVQGSPFTCNVGDPDLVTVRHVPSQIKQSDLGQPLSFEIDASAAGSGNLEIMINGGRIPCNVKELGGRQYLATFVPNHSITHVIEMRFNGDLVKGSPWRIEVSMPLNKEPAPVQPAQAYVLAPTSFAYGATTTGSFPTYASGPMPIMDHTTRGTTTSFRSEVEREQILTTQMPPQETAWVEIQGVGLQKACVGKVASFEIGARGVRSDDIFVRITAPSGKDVPCKTITTQTGNFRCEYVATEVGSYRMDLSISGRPIEGSPFTISTYAPHKVQIDPIPGGAVGKPVQFFVDANEAGKGQLEISVNQGRVPNNVQMQGPGRCLVTFIPHEPGTYIVEVTFNGDLVRGCPARVEVHERGRSSEERSPYTTPIATPDSSALRSMDTRYARSYSQMSPPGNQIRATSVHQPWSSSSENPSITMETRSFSAQRREDLSTTGYPRQQNGLSPRDRMLGPEDVSFSMKSYLTNVPSRVPRTQPPPPTPPLPQAKTTTTTYERRIETTRDTSPRSFGSRDYKRELQDGNLEISTERKPLETTRDRSPRPLGSRDYRRELQDGNLEISTERKPLETTRDRSPRPLGSRDYRRELQDGNLEISTERKPLETTRDRSPRPLGSRDYRRELQDGNLEISMERKPLETTRERSPRPLGSGDYRRELQDRNQEFSPERKPLETARERSPRPFGSRDYRRENGNLEFSRERKPPSPPPHQNVDRPPSPRIVSSPQEGRREYIPRYQQEAGSGWERRRQEALSSPGTTVARYDDDIPPPAPPHSRQQPPQQVVGAGFREKSYEERLSEWRVAESTQEPPPAPPPLPKHTEVDEFQGPSINYRKRKPPEDSRVNRQGGFFGIQQETHEFVRSRDVDMAEDRYKVTRSRSPEERQQGSSINDTAEPPPTVIPDTKEESSPPPRPVGPTEEEIAEARVEGPAIGVIRLRKPTYFDIRPLHCDRNQMKVVIMTPSKKSLEPKLRETRNGFVVEFSPQEVGTHKVHVTVNDLPHPNSPFPCKVYEPENIFVSKISDGIIGQPVEFTVDAGTAGYGNLEIAIKDDAENIVPSNVTPLQGQHSRSAFVVSFIPNHRGVYYVHISFNGEDLEDSRPSTSHMSTKLTISVNYLTQCEKFEASPFMCAVEGVIEPKTTYPLGLGDTGPPVEDASESIPTPDYSDYGREEETVLTESKESSLNYVTPVVKDDPKVPPPPPFVENGHGPRAETPPERPPSPVVRKETPPPAEIREEKIDTQREIIVERTEAADSAKKEAPPPPLAKGKALIGLHSEELPKLVRVDGPVGFRVRPPGPGPITVVVTGPNGQEIPVKVVDTGSSTYKAEFVPQLVGDHMVMVRFADVDVTGSPFTCRVYDAKKIKVGEIPNGYLEKSVHFVVDASEAGVGNLEVAVNEGRIPSMAHSLGQHRYDISFIPRELENHTISIRFNNEPVLGSPFVCRIFTSSQATASGPGLERVSVKKITHFVVEPQGPATDQDVEVSIKDPSGQLVPVNVSKTPQMTFRVEYSPQVVGNHQINVSCGESEVSGSPFTAKAYDASRVKLHPVEGNVVGRPSSFYIDAAKAGAGNMEIIVSVEGRNVPNFVQAEGNAKFKVSFTPQEPKPHLISVKFNGESVPGSPMTCHIIDGSQCVATGDGLRVAPVNKTAWFAVDPSGAGGGECNVVVTASDGGAVPVRCFQQEDGKYRVEYTPTLIGICSKTEVTLFPFLYKYPTEEAEIQGLNQQFYQVTGIPGVTGAIDGEHKIEVTFADLPISGSPFICEVIDTTKIKLFHQDNASYLLGQQASVQVSKKDCGKGDLEVKVIDPKGIPLDYEIAKIPGGDEEIVFLPKVIGPHQLCVTFCGYEVQNSPLTVLVEESSRPVAFGDGLKKAVVHEPAKFSIDSKKNKGGLKVDISGPNYKAKHTTSKKDGILDISYTPIEAGYHTVNILWNNKALSGSPFQVPVVDPSRVRIVGSGLDSRGNIPMVINTEKQLSIDAVEAGPGELRAEVRGPNGRVPSSLDQLSGGKYRLAFTPNVDGEHSVYLYWSDLPVPSCPVQGWAEMVPIPVEVEVAAPLATSSTIEPPPPPPPPEFDSDTPDNLRVVLRGDGLSKARTKEQSEFIVDGSETSSGKPKCTMMGQKADIPVNMNHLGNNVWRATYTPLIPGTYSLEISWSDFPVRGSPFKVPVSISGDASKVVVSAEALRMGIIGQELKTVIDTRVAGPGHLTAQCIGPNKAAYCELYDHNDGTYTLCIKPTETGRHTLVIKYSDENVPGSPFSLYISNPPDASKVRVYGPGIEHGILSRFKSNFVVETKGAGAGQLTVRVRGPKGAFNVEMQREKKQDRTIHCKYEPREPGDYQLEVKWASEHVPGSPFLVMIFDTQQELERYLAGQPPSPSPQMPYLPPGWIGPPPPGMMLPGGPFQPLPGPGPMGQGPPMLPPPTFPQRGLPYANSTIYSTTSSRHKFLTAQNGY